MTPEKLATLRKQKENLEKKIKEAEAQLEEQNHPLVTEIKILEKKLNDLYKKLKKEEEDRANQDCPPLYPKWLYNPGLADPRFIPSTPRPEKFYYLRSPIMSIAPHIGYNSHLVPYATSTKGSL